VQGLAFKLKVTPLSTATLGVEGCKLRVKDTNLEGSGR
jgi:hypothetical protein